ncbi:META domain-containing protein [Antarcticibacterium sp. 1MA-6-2]|uniref:META domain-containing protein n=1 Tax=Antarcticibacterium sp. 1MA-6-2 TaxID=2908210 RepID=UPI001F1ABFE4|nr:META domain-containing protein [Antarcticibacterium sp. 1MA-6-2]UJH92086.1 META domain-containing protein [Antarcticibacterium sp. 1MA-6-2]
MNTKIRILFISILVIFTSCKNEDHSGKVVLDSTSDSTSVIDRLNGSWKLIRVNDTSFTIENVYPINYGGQPKIAIDTDERKIGGFTGCNTWGTTLNIVDNSIVFIDSIEKHEQGCGGTWEAEYLNLLKNNKSFTVQDDHLKLTSSDNKTLTFQRVK